MSNSTSDLIFTARYQVEQYREQGDALMADHQAAMECRDCEDFLQLGISSYEWLAKSEQTLREASYGGQIEFTPELRDLIDSLYVIWQTPCSKAESLIQQTQSRGFRLDNLDRFREVCAIVDEEIQTREWQKLGRDARAADEVSH